MKFSVFMNLPLLCLFLSCSNKVETDNHEEARLLFSESTQLIILVTNQIKTSSDSLEVDSLTKFYEKRISDINFSYSPQTDLKLTEMENDSLYNLIKKMQSVKSKKLKDFAISSTDTLLVINNNEKYTNEENLNN